MNTCKKRSYAMKFKNSKSINEMMVLGWGYTRSKNSGVWTKEDNFNDFSLV
jgi:hypothetical protein